MDNFSYFQKRTDERLESIEKKLDKLLEFKWKLGGIVVSISAIVSLAIGLASIYFGAR